MCQLRAVRSQRRAIAALLVACTLWGTSFLVTKVAVATVSPAVVTTTRCAIAALLLSVLVRVTARSAGRVSAPVAAVDSGAGRRATRWLAGRGAVIACGAATGLAFLLIAEGMQDVGSGPAGIILSTVPVWTIIIAAMVGLGDVRPRQLLAVGLGTLAVVVLALVHGDGGSQPIAIAGLVALAGAGVAHGSANVASQVALRRQPALSVAATTLAVATVVTLPLALASLPSALPSAASIAAIIALGVLPSGVAYVLFFHAVSVFGPTRASLSNYLMPPIAIIAGMLALGEQPGLATVIALALAAGALVLGLGDRLLPEVLSPRRRSSLTRSGS